MLKVELHSNEIYSFHNIRSVLIEDYDYITIVGNFEKGRRYKQVKLRTEMIKNYKNVIKKITENLTAFEYEGVCPYCDSENIWEMRNVRRLRHLNKRNQVEYENNFSSPIAYRCKRCSKEFPPSKIKKVNIIKYGKHNRNYSKIKANLY